MTAPDPFGGRIVVVSGKGGTGKTTVAAALAMAAARAGRRVVLAEAEGRDGPARLLGVPPPGFEERPTRWGFALLSITPREALLEYLWLFLRVRSLSRTLARSNVVEVVTDGIPGFRDTMTAGKLYELTEHRDGRRDRDRDRRPYDLVVVDAPPTGQLLGFLGAPRAYGDIIRAGRAHRQLVSIDRLIRERSRIVLVAIPEEMSVAETVETAQGLRDAGFPEPLIAANRLRPPVFPRGLAAAGSRLDAAGLADALRGAGVEANERKAAELLGAARDEEARVRAERRAVRRLRSAAPVIELPLLASAGFGAEQVAILAERFSP